MNQVVKAATPEEIARVEAQNKQAEAAQESKPAPPRLVGREGKERERVIPLEFPVEYDGKLYEELTVRRINGKDFSAMSAFDGNKESVLLASLMTSAPVEVIEALDGDDFVELQEAVEAFLPRKLRQMAEQISGTGPNTRQ